MCEGIRASERAKWLEDNSHMTPEQAIEHVMREFPHVFRFEPQAMLDGTTAQARMEWLLSNNPSCKGNPDAAMKQVIAEFPWHDDIFCDGIRAAERAQWLQSNQGMTLEAAQKRVMDESPASFAVR